MAVQFSRTAQVAVNRPFDVFQNRAEMSILGDRGMGHTLLVFVEHRVGDRDTFPADLKSHVWESKSLHVFARQAACDLVLTKDDPLAFVKERQLWSDDTFIVLPDTNPTPQNSLTCSGTSQTAAA